MLTNFKKCILQNLAILKNLNIKCVRVTLHFTLTPLLCICNVSDSEDERSNIQCIGCVQTFDFCRINMIICERH